MLRSASCDLGAELGDVLSRRALLTLHDVKLDTLAFSQRLEAVAVDGGVVNEAILLSVLRRDEAKTLGVVEPLHFAGGTHCGTSSFNCVGVPCLRYLSDYCLFAAEVAALTARNQKRPGKTPGPLNGKLAQSRNQCASCHKPNISRPHGQRSWAGEASSYAGSTKPLSASPYASTTPAGPGTVAPVSIDFIIRALATALPL